MSFSSNSYAKMSISTDKCTATLLQKKSQYPCARLWTSLSRFLIKAVSGNLNVVIPARTPLFSPNLGHVTREGMVFNRVSLYGIVFISECFGRGDLRIIFKSIIDRFRIAFEANVRFAFMFSCGNKFRDENVTN